MIVTLWQIESKFVSGFLVFTLLLTICSAVQAQQKR